MSFIIAVRRILTASNKKISRNAGHKFWAGYCAPVYSDNHDKRSALSIAAYVDRKWLFPKLYLERNSSYSLLPSLKFILREKMTNSLDTAQKTCTTEKNF